MCFPFVDEWRRLPLILIHSHWSYSSVQCIEFLYHPSPPPWRCGPTRAMVSSFLRFLDHTQRRTTVGRTPLDEWSARRRDALPDNTQQSQQTDIHVPGGIRTHNLSRRAAVDLRLRLRGHWDRLFIIQWHNQNSCKAIFITDCSPELKGSKIHALKLYLLTWRIWWAPNNASKGQMGFNSAFEGLNCQYDL